MGLTTAPAADEAFKKPPDKFLGASFFCVLRLCITCVLSVYYVSVFIGFHKFLQSKKTAYLLYFLEFPCFGCFFNRNCQPQKIGTFPRFCVLCVLYHWGCMPFCRVFQCSSYLHFIPCAIPCQETSITVTRSLRFVM